MPVLYFLSSRWLSRANEASRSFALEWTNLMKSFNGSWCFISPSWLERALRAVPLEWVVHPWLPAAPPGGCPHMRAFWGQNLNSCPKKCRFPLLVTKINLLSKSVSKFYFTSGRKARWPVCSTVQGDTLDWGGGRREMMSPFKCSLSLGRLTWPE